jgi:hypothetical protein
VERYDVATDTWTVVINMLKGRCAAFAVAIVSAVIMDNHLKQRIHEYVVYL